MALLNGKPPVAEHAGLLIVHRRHGTVVEHLLHVPLLREALHVEMKGVINLLVEQHTARLSTARPRRSGTKARHETIGDETVIQTALVEGIEAILGELLLLLLELMLLLLQQLKFEVGLCELPTALGYPTCLGNLWRDTMSLCLRQPSIHSSRGSTYDTDLRGALEHSEDIFHGSLSSWIGHATQRDVLPRVLVWNRGGHAGNLLAETRTGRRHFPRLRVEELCEAAAFAGRIVGAARNIAPRRIQMTSRREPTGVQSAELAERGPCFAGVSENSSFSGRGTGGPSEALVHLCQMNRLPQIF